MLILLKPTEHELGALKALQTALVALPLYALSDGAEAAGTFIVNMSLYLAWSEMCNTGLKPISVTRTFST